MGSTEMHHLLSVAMAFLPPGFRFHPTEEELVVNYLSGGNQEFVVIPEIDICEFEPEMLPIQFKEKSMVRSNDPEWWFLCKQEQGQKARRSTREGYWKITGSPSEVKSSDNNNQIIGSKRFLTFYRKVQGSKDIKSNWVMHEYYLPDANRSSYVICHVKLKTDDKAVSRQSFSLPHTEPQINVNHFNGSDSSAQLTGSWSISSPSISSRSERIDWMDLLEDSEPEHCKFSEDQIQMRMLSLFSSLETPNDSFSQDSFIAEGNREVMEFSFSSEDQDSQFNIIEESENQDFWNDIPEIGGRTLNQFGGSVEVQNSRREAANIRENTQTQTMKPVMSFSRVCVIDEEEEEEGFIEKSSDHTFESKLEDFGENSVPVKSVVLNRSSKLNDEFLHYEYPASCRNRKVKMETEAFKTKVKEVKKHGSATDHHVKKIKSAALVFKKSKNSGQEARLNCKTESASYDNRVCDSTPPICYLVNLFVGIMLLFFFLGQVF